MTIPDPQQLLPRINEALRRIKPSSPRLTVAQAVAVELVFQEVLQALTACTAQREQDQQTIEELEAAPFGKMRRVMTLRAEKAERALAEAQALIASLRGELQQEREGHQVDVTYLKTDLAATRVRSAELEKTLDWCQWGDDGFCRECQGWDERIGVTNAKMHTATCPIGRALAASRPASHPSETK